MTLTQPQQAYLNWLRQYDPAIYSVFQSQLKMANAANQLSAANGDNNLPIKPKNWFTNLADNLSKSIKKISTTVQEVLPTYQAFKVSEAEIRLQTERVKKGLPPKPTKPPTQNPPPQTPAQKQAVEDVAAVTYSTKTPWMQSLATTGPLLIGGGFLYLLMGKK